MASLRHCVDSGSMLLYVRYVVVHCRAGRCDAGEFRCSNVGLLDDLGHVQGTSTEVEVSLFINNIDSVSEQTMDFSVNAFVTQKWMDRRLRFLGLIDAEYLELDTKLMENIWVPDLYFLNEKSASFHTVTVPNKMLHIYNDGEIIYRLRISLTASCPMLLHKYPMDSQVCHLFIQSFAFTKKSIVFKWRSEDAIQTSRNLQLPQFTLTRTEFRNCSDFEGSENFTCIASDFYLQRSIGFYMIQIYIPSVLIVLLSWVSFWLNVDAVPARISLGILTVLTMTTQKSMAVSSLPRVSYVKAIDVWMAACLCFVFSSLLEFALVNVIDRRQIKRKHLPADHTIDGAKTLLRVPNCEIQSKWVDDPAGKVRARQVDNFSRVFFPSAFVIFCLAYWPTYLE
ncbi:glycine receptor subunit alphaZ1-like [Gigantopelta aegis]|uniref:glycine receptor subunit alphaZ1-like n=1 Tax=Gigantopelta aegis TaxID=1735272 RepID=UPI001B888886|nr:glycine receptor subunit alphaZ1-like [Gigantopelta aegis]